MRWDFWKDFATNSIALDAKIWSPNVLCYRTFLFEYSEKVFWVGHWLTSCTDTAFDHLCPFDNRLERQSSTFLSESGLLLRLASKVASNSSKKQCAAAWSCWLSRCLVSKFRCLHLQGIVAFSCCYFRLCSLICFQRLLSCDELRLSLLTKLFPYFSLLILSFLSSLLVALNQLVLALSLSVCSNVATWLFINLLRLKVSEGWPSPPLVIIAFLRRTSVPVELAWAQVRRIEAAIVVAIALTSTTIAHAFEYTI